MRFSKQTGSFLVALMGLSIIPSLNVYAGVDSTYSFKVFLEEEEIGQQHFVVSSNKVSTTVQIEARFEVKYWFYTAYEYHHTNTETWNDGCVSQIRSETNDNGDTYFVQGSYADGRLTLVTQDGARTLDGCVKTFAYWDQEFLKSRSLLNSQTGEMNRVAVRNLGEETITVRNQPTAAIHYQLVAEKFSIDLWYAPGGEWVALQSTTEGDSRLRYELQ